MKYCEQAYRLALVAATLKRSIPDLGSEPALALALQLLAAAEKAIGHVAGGHKL